MFYDIEMVGVPNPMARHRDLLDDGDTGGGKTLRTNETVKRLQTEVGLLNAKLAQQQSEMAQQRQHLEQRVEQQRQQLEQRVEQQRKQIDQVSLCLNGSVAVVYRLQNGRHRQTPSGHEDCLVCRRYHERGI